MGNKFFQNTCKPQGTLGKFMLKGMDTGHAKLSSWGLSILDLPSYEHILDVGCGGGANVAAMLERAPKSTVDGLDYSETSVAYSRKTNEASLGQRCTIQQGNVMSLPYPDNSLNLVTAFETIYFWPDIDLAFAEIFRVLKEGGAFLICCEFDDSSDTTWTKRIDGMVIYRSEEMKERLLANGFRDVQTDRHEKGWVRVLAKK